MPGDSSSGSRGSRRRLALAALALPILAMMGLFGWAGAQAAVSPIQAAQSFITAFNNRDCATMSAELYISPGASLPSCKDLTGGGATKLLDCKITLTSPPTTDGQVTESAPSGYEDPGYLKASCVEEGPVTKGKRVPLVLDIFVATNPNTSQQMIISLQAAS